MLSVCIGLIAVLNIVSPCQAQGDLGDRLGLGGRTSRTQHEATDIPATVKLIIEGTNAFRTQNKLKPLKADSRLTKASDSFAAYLAEHGELSHEADGRRPAERANAAGYDYAVIAENIADEMKSSGFTPKELAEGFLEGWKESPGHRKNLLDPSVTQIGVGIAFNPPSNTYYAVQLFGRPKSAGISFEITNKTDEPINYKFAGRENSLPPGATMEHTQPASRELIFFWPSGKAPAGGKKTLRPKDGDHVLITLDADGHFAVKVESPPGEPKKPARSTTNKDRENEKPPVRK